MNAAPASASSDDPQIAGPITRETPADAAAVDALVIAAFGPGRFAKTAERLRERRRWRPVSASMKTAA
ncbi:hypothetical protein V8F63_10945 [Brevundimonas sp. LF-1]|uniref:hypothetical protein n=1 Tax=Brevundimonas sp. LF-1 TaxID=3126100 RepID=UPI0030DFCD51